MTTERFPSKAGLKTATSAALTAVTLAVVASGLTVPMGWAIRPLLIALTVFALVIAIGAALAHAEGDA